MRPIGLEKLKYDPYDDRYKSNPTGLVFRSKGTYDRLLNIPREKVACIDVETTGLHPGNDEVLQLSICNGNGEILVNSYVCPVKRKRWPNAQSVHGITWQMVKDAPLLTDLAEPVEEILNECELLIGYNIKRFDFGFLLEGRIDIPRGIRVYDLIEDCSVLHGKWNDYHGDYTFPKLQKVAGEYGITYDAHDSANDVIATTKLFYALLNGDAMAEKLDTYRKIDEEKERKRLAEQEELERKAAEKKVVQEEKEQAEKKEREKREMEGHNNVIWLKFAFIILLILMLTMCTGSCFGRR